MQRADAVRYLEQAGFHYKPAESPDLWSYLEGHFAGPQALGPKFDRMTSSFVTELIEKGEDALLEAMVTHHRKQGRLDRVSKVIDLPFVVGTGAAVPLAKADARYVLKMIAGAGTSQERIVHVMPAEPDEIPSTSQVTVTGGLYADGHTAGYFDLRPGEWTDDGAETYAWLATHDEIAALTREMEERVEEVTVVTRRECQDMIAKAGRLFK